MKVKTNLHVGMFLPDVREKDLIGYKVPISTDRKEAVDMPTRDGFYSGFIAGHEPWYEEDEQRPDLPAWLVQRVEGHEIHIVRRGGVQHIASETPYSFREESGKHTIVLTCGSCCMPFRPPRLFGSMQ